MPSGDHPIHTHVRATGGDDCSYCSDGAGSYIGQASGGGYPSSERLHVDIRIMDLEVGKQMLETLPRCQTECTRLIEENRKLTVGTKAAMDSFVEIADKYEKVMDKLELRTNECDAAIRRFDALVKEYDEEVISHDIVEKDLKGERNKLRNDVERIRIDNANLLGLLRDVRDAIKDSITAKLSMNNMKYNSIGMRVVEAIQERKSK